MKKAAILLTSLLIAFVTGCQDHNLEPHPEDVMAWRAGGPSGDAGQSIAVDQNGNTYVTGYFSSTATFGSITLTTSGSRSLFIAKYNNKGEIQWAQKVEGLSVDVMDIAVDGNSNVYITGHFTSNASFGTTTITSPSANMFVAKYSSSGEIQWVRNSGSAGPFNWGFSITTDGLGNVFVAGQFTETITFGTTTFTSQGGLDAFIIKYNSEGEVLWAQKVANPSVNVSATGVAVDENGNAYITGWFQNTATFGTTTLTKAGGFDNDSNLFIAKYSSSGEFLWAQSGGFVGSGTGISVDKNGNAYVTGSINVSRFDSQLYVARYNTSGERLWSKFIGTMGRNNRGEDIAVDKTGNVYLTGFTSASQLDFVHYPFTNPMDRVIIDLVHYGSNDVFVAKFANNGNLFWARTAGGTGNDVGNGIALDEMGNPYVTGSFDGSATFGTTPLNSAGSWDVFVAKFKQ